jgi:hypothetical protein
VFESRGPFGSGKRPGPNAAELKEQGVEKNTQRNMSGDNCFQQSQRHMKGLYDFDLQRKNALLQGAGANDYYESPSEGEIY